MGEEGLAEVDDPEADDPGVVRTGAEGGGDGSPPYSGPQGVQRLNAVGWLAES
jgi:hypothetical protein